MTRVRRRVCSILFVVIPALFLSAYAGYCQDKFTGDVTVGYTLSSGNTSKSALNASASAKKSFDKLAISAKGDIFYSSSKHRMDDQKWDALGRGDYSFGNKDRWYAFAQGAVDHDRFSDIKIRTVPSGGLGYWLFKQDTFKWNIEGGVGYQITEYESGKSTQRSMIGIGKTHLEKTLFQKSKVAEDFTILPSFQGDGFRINNQVEFLNPINNMLSISIKYITDYNSKPAVDVKKVDNRLVAGVKYAF